MTVHLTHTYNVISRQPEDVTGLRRIFREVKDVRHETSSNVRLLRKETTLDLRQLLRDCFS